MISCCAFLPALVFLLISPQTLKTDPVMTGLDNLLQNRPELIAGRKIGIVTNHTGVDGEGVPIWKRINAVALFSPEHGLFGEASDGMVVSYEEPIENLPRIYSLYGKNRKPTPDMLEGLDLILYDIMDVGVRAYTFISTMGLVMEAAGEAGIPMLVLDRPNPVTGTRLGGPVLNPEFRSFTGYYPIPVQYGLTPGELARMAVGEKWVEPVPDLEVIPLLSWERGQWYDEIGLKWIPPSPNIPKLTSAIHYPGMVLIEATNVSEGRGTDHPFEWVGAPWIDGEKLSREMNQLNLPGVEFRAVKFIPRNIPGTAAHPKFEGMECEGIESNITDRDSYESVKTGIALILTLKRLYPAKLEIREKAMNRLSGSSLVNEGIEKGWSLADILSKFEQELRDFDVLRTGYLLY